MNGLSTAPPTPRARPFRVGLTGGIATGKTTVAKLFAALGVPVIDLDQVARDVVAPGSSLLKRVISRFGPELLQPDGSLNRRLLRSRVFADAALRLQLEAMLHPAILAKAEQLSAAAGSAYQVIVNPLLVEAGAQARYDRVLLVDSDEQQQRERLTKRDGPTTPEIDAMLAAQTTRQARAAVADDIIHNSASLESLEAQVAALHQRYLGLARRSSTIVR